MTHFTTRRCLLALASLAFLSLPAHADLITFSTRPAFNAAAPGLSVETFESGTAPAPVLLCGGPLSSTMGGGCFPVGGLLPGVTYNASGSVQPNMVVLAAGLVGNPSRVIGPNIFADTLNLTFANANAVGFDVFSGPLAGNVAISVFSPDDVLLGTFSVFAPIGGTFFGVISTTSNVGRININSLAPVPGELVDNVAFGAAAPIPEPTTMLLLGTGLAGISAAVRKRRKKAE